MSLRLDKESWARVAPYLDEALEIAPDELEGWFAHQTAQSPEIAAAVRALLAQRAALDARGFLATPPLDEIAAVSMVGQRIGAYTIESLLGRGGMGEVWLAARNDGRFEGRCAVKFLDPSLAAARTLDRFRREGRVLARLTHPNIARLVDAGVTHQDRPYLVLEYVEGRRIDQFCEAHSLDTEARVRLFLDVLSAVAHAHSKLIVHRDIKPSNVLVTTAGAVKLLDFGIAKLLGTELLDDGDTTPTRLEDIILTPDYAAPEQILGEPASAATDVYQLGVLLYALLAGRLPLAVVDMSRSERVKAALEKDPPRLSEVSPKHLRKKLRGDLDAIVTKTLRKRADERYASAAALAEDLQRFLNHEPVSARDGAFAYRCRKFVRRYRGAVAATAAAALVLMIATLFAVLQMREAQAQRDQARFQEKRAEAESQFMTLMMSTLGSGQRPVTPAQILDNGVALLDKQYRGDPEFRATMLLRMASRFMDLGDVPKEYAVLVKAEAIVKQRSDYSQIAQVECNLVETEIGLGHAERAPARLAAGWSALSHESRPKPAARVECLYADALVDEANGKLPAAIRKAEYAVALLDLAGETRGLQYSDLLSLVAALYSENGDFRKAFEYHQRDGIALERSGQDQTVSGVSVLHNVAADLMSFGEIREALAREQDVVARWRANSIDGSVRPELLNVYGNLQLRMGHAEAASASFQESISEAHREQDLESELFARAGLASALLASGRLDAAKAQLTELFPLTLGHETEHRRSLARARITNAELLLARGQPDDARAQIDATLQMLRTGAIAGSYLGFALLKSSRIGIAAGRFEDAERCATEALALFERRALKPELSADVGEALLLTAEARRGRGDNRGAHTAAAVAAPALIAGLGPEHALAREALAMR